MSLIKIFLPDCCLLLLGCSEFTKKVIKKIFINKMTNENFFIDISNINITKINIIF